MHIMLDLETWGTRAGCAIRSIGACVFDAKGVGNTFYRNVTDASCEAAGLKQEPGTVKFWSEQGDTARAAFDADQVSLGHALLEFNDWWAAERGKFIWGMGANFDPPIIEAAYEAVMLDAPWKFWDVRCCRTVLASADRRPERVKGDTKHHALDDAIAQAKAVSAAFRTGNFRLA
jgi:hypothetical protein